MTTSSRFPPGWDRWSRNRAVDFDKDDQGAGNKLLLQRRRRRRKREAAGYRVPRRKNPRVQVREFCNARALSQRNSNNRFMCGSSDHSHNPAWPRSSVAGTQIDKRHSILKDGMAGGPS